MNDLSRDIKVARKNLVVVYIRTDLQLCEVLLDGMIKIGAFLEMLDFSQETMEALGHVRRALAILTKE